MLMSTCAAEDSSRVQLSEACGGAVEYVNLVDDKSHFIGKSLLDTVIAGLKADRRRLKSEFEVQKHQCFLNLFLVHRYNVSTFSCVVHSPYLCLSPQHLLPSSPHCCHNRDL